MSNYIKPTNSFTKGNQHYKEVQNIGRKPTFNTPNDLWQAARSYFQYCKDNPRRYYTSKRGKLVIIYKIMPMSVKGLCSHLGIATLAHYRKRADFTEVVGRIDAVIYVHNYTAAVVGLLHGGMSGQHFRSIDN